MISPGASAAIGTTGSASPAVTRLDAAVRGLTRARWRQILVEHAWTGLFVGLAVSCAAVLAIRLGELTYSPWHAVGVLVAVAVAAAAMVGWRRRPDDMQVAIATDIELNLKQKLSTAWEFQRPDLRTDPALAERLAVQAVRERLPVSYGRVFPLGVSRWGRLTPVAALLLVLLASVDMQRVVAPRASIVDEAVVEEGTRLREYGQRMEGRARRGELPRSEEASRGLQRLGARMEAGTFSRGQVLRRLHELARELDEQRASALREGVAGTGGPPEARSQDNPVLRGSGVREALRLLRNGRLGPGDAERLREELQGLTSLGITTDELEVALARSAAGDDEGLERILERLATVERGLREADELVRAGDQVARTRENLGDADASRGVTPGGLADGRGDGPGDASDPEWGERGLGDGAWPGPGVGRGGDAAADGRSSTPRPSRESAGAALRPEGQLREGVVFSSSARVSPRAGRLTLADVELDARFAGVVEEALSSEAYPPHRKEFIRRYFLSLSAGAGAGEGSGEEGRP